MSYRSVAVRLTLAVAALTTVATSAPDNFVLSDMAERTLSAGPTRISVVPNRVAVNHGDRVSLTLQLSATGGTAPFTVTIVPDDAVRPAETIEISSVAREVEYDLTELCPHDQDCDAGVTVEVPSRREVDAIATASVLAYGDSRFLFPDDRSFPPDATVTVGFGP